MLAIKAKKKKKTPNGLIYVEYGLPAEHNSE